MKNQISNHYIGFYFIKKTYNQAKAVYHSLKSSEIIIL